MNKNKMFILLLLLFVTMLPFISFTMELPKQSSSYYGEVIKNKKVVQPIDPADLPGLIGKVVLWKKNDRDFIPVQLGESIADGVNYKVYLTENAGVFCFVQDLYQLKEQK